MSALPREIEDVGLPQNLELQDPSLLLDRDGEDVLSTLRPTGERRRQPSVVPVAPTGTSKGPLRIGGVPSASSRTSLAKEDGIAANLAKLAGEIAQLRTLTKSDPVAGDSRIDDRHRRDVAAIKGSIEQLEAFLSITLLERLDQMVDEKLTVIHKTQASNQRTSRWLKLFIVLSLVLAGALVLEAVTGAVISTLETGAIGLAALLQETWHHIARGFDGLVEISRNFAAHLRL